MTATWGRRTLIVNVISWRTLTLLLLIVSSSAIATAAHRMVFHAVAHLQWKAPSGHEGSARVSRGIALGIQEGAPMSMPTSVANLLVLQDQPRPTFSPLPAVFVPPRS